MPEHLQPVLRVLNEDICAEEREANFRRSISKIIVQKYGGDVFAYIKNLHDTIETLEVNLEAVNDAYLEKAA